MLTTPPSPQATSTIPTERASDKGSADGHACAGIDAYLAEVYRLGSSTSAQDRHGAPVPLAAAIEDTVSRSLRATSTDGRVLFVGNGGSAAIASHMAIDFSKNGGIRALSFNDGAALTCLGNDLGYERIFAAQIEMHGRPGDLLMAISSSGQSANVLNAVASARRLGMEIVTFSGFKPSNPLRRTGDVNYFVDSDRYGFVEICHLTLIHAVLDHVGGLQQRPAC